jgi:hypothetical protein
VICGPASGLACMLVSVSGRIRVGDAMEPAEEIIEF